MPNWHPCRYLQQYNAELSGHSEINLELLQPLQGKEGFRGWGFRFSGFGFQDSGFGDRVSGFGLQVSGFGFRLQEGRHAACTVEGVHCTEAGSSQRSHNFGSCISERERNKEKREKEHRAASK